jgi:hypothetical protein
VVPDRKRNRMHPAAGVQFSDRGCHMLVDGPLRDLENLADLPRATQVRTSSSRVVRSLLSDLSLGKSRSPRRAGKGIIWREPH